MNEKNKVDGLNIFRMIAFVCVFLLHAKIFMPMPWYEGIDNPWLLYTPAWAGVWMFLLVSGYGIGAGFYSNKYEISINGIAKFYLARLKGIVPLYWFYIFVVALFINPTILLPRGENVQKILSLLFFNYQEEFDSLQYGLSWYLTTLLRLYIIAPFFFILIRKIIKNKRQSLLMIVLILAVGMAARTAMGYHISLIEEGNWSSSIYKPFYFNLDIFCVGFLLNAFKGSEKRYSNIGRVVSLLMLVCLIIVNSYLYYFGNYYGNVRYMDIYCYLFPTVYILIGSIYIYYFDIRKDYRQTRISIQQLKKNPLRIFDYFNKIQMPMYLFHSTVLLCLQNGYNDEKYTYFAWHLGASPNNVNFIKGCLFTLYAFVLTLVWSMIISYLFSGRKESPLFNKLNSIDYEIMLGNLKEKFLLLLKTLFPLKKKG